MTHSIYLDHAATTPIDPQISVQLAEWYRSVWANPASQHRAGRAAQAIIEDAKDRIKVACLGLTSTRDLSRWQVIITSGGTEANNLALHGLISDDTPNEITDEVPNGSSKSSSHRLFVSATEHPSIFSTATESPHLRKFSQVIPIDPTTGGPNIDALDAWLSANSSLRSRNRPLVSVMLGNNETGIINDIESVSAVCRRHGALLHCDCVQAIGKVQPSDYVPYVDALTISAHKLHGPVGVGALLVAGHVTLQPLLLGGGQQLALRPGTESVPLTCALASACEMAEAHRVAGQMNMVEQLRTRFETMLEIILPHKVVVIGSQWKRLPHISSVAFPGLDRQALLMALDMAGIACSSGSACASGSSQPSHVLLGMGLPESLVQSALRFSFARTTTVEDVQEAVNRIVDVVSRRN